MKEGQPKHRQADRERARLDRRKASRAGLPTALIVCEGSKTEPHYLRGLLEHLGVNAANVDVVPGGRATDAPALVRLAQQRFRSNPEYDRVFVVLDGDQPHLAAARTDAARTLRKSDRGAVTVDLIVSVPCFEFWLLLHFESTTRDCDSAEAIAALRGHLPDYTKGDPTVVAQVAGSVDLAESRALQVNRTVEAAGGQSPHTDMPALVSALRAMSRRPAR